MNVNDKILITGGSGFIGTNLIEFLISKGYKKIINFDFNEPKIKKHLRYWIDVDIRNKSNLKKVFVKIKPSFIIHLAARTDLTGQNIYDYDSNTIGTKNFIDLCNIFKPKVFIHISTRLVNINGFKPTNYSFHNPDTNYGKSKSISEKYFKNARFKHIILRPTSIWGPYFGEPFLNFFKLISNGLYFHPSIKNIYKTMGYIDNSCSQIFYILSNYQKFVSQILYIGDSEPTNIYLFSKKVSYYFNNKLPIIKIPYIFSYVIFFLCQVIFRKYSPVTINKLNNIITNSIYDVEIPVDNYVTVDEGIRRTIQWIKK